MNSKDQGIVVTALLGLAAVFNEPMGDKRITGYLADLDRLDGNQVMIAMRLHLSNGGKMPESKALVFFAKSISRGIPESQEPKQGEITSKEQRDYCLDYAANWKKEMGWEE